MPLDASATHDHPAGEQRILTLVVRMPDGGRVAG